MDIKEYKRLARENLSGNWGNEALFYFLYTIVATLPTYILTGNWVVEILVSLLIMPLAFGMVYHYMKIGRNMSGEYKDLFLYYEKFERLVKVVVINLLVIIKVFLWTLLFIIPGIIASYKYYLVSFIYADNPDMEASEIVKLSGKMMDGFKWEAFVLGLSFIGWIILSILTLGIGFFFLIPYMQVTQYHFYDRVKKSYLGESVEENVFTESEQGQEEEEEEKKEDIYNGSEEK